MLFTAPIRTVALAPDDWAVLRSLPWGVPLESWEDPEYGVAVIDQRRGLSRHPVIFVHAGTSKYAIKETSPQAAESEIANYHEIARRGCPSLVPVGTVTVIGETIDAGVINGVRQYESGDYGYCITRLATRVLPHSLLYQYPFSDANKKLLLVAIAKLMVTLHAAGVYWGDASLANSLVNIGRRQLVAILADAETVNLYPMALTEVQRQSDIEYFQESLAMQSEDIRIARDLADDEVILDESDGQYFLKMYERLRTPNPFVSLSQEIERAITAMGGGVLDISAWAWRAGISSVENTLRPNWYRDQLRDLMGIWIPRTYARRVYDLVLGHKWILSEEEGHDVGLAVAAQDWRERYHEPIVELLQAYNPGKPIDFDRYLQIMHHIWILSKRTGRVVALEEGAIDYLLPKTSVTESLSLRVEE